MDHKLDLRYISQVMDPGSSPGRLKQDQIEQNKVAPNFQKVILNTTVGHHGRVCDPGSINTLSIDAVLGVNITYATTLVNIFISIYWHWIITALTKWMAPKYSFYSKP